MDSYTRDNLGILFGVVVAIVLRFLDFGAFVSLFLGVLVFYVLRFCVPLSTPSVFASKGVAVVTGATMGIGHAIVEVLLKDGWKHMVIVARPSTHLSEVVESFKAKYPRAQITSIGADLSVPSSWESLTNKLKSELNLEVDLLVNNAGFGAHGSLKDADLAVNTGMVELNCNAVVALTRLLLPSMVSRHRGMVVHIASTAAFQPCPGMSVYGATKAFLFSFAEATAFELRGSGVHCLCVCPGPVSTPFLGRANIGNLRMFKYLSVQTAKEVAEETYTAMKKGNRILITGMNGILPTFQPFLPQTLLLWFAQFLMSNHH